MDLKNLKKQIRVRIVGTLGALALFLLFLSLRKRVIGRERLALLDDGLVIFAFWHGRQIIMGEFYRWVGKGRGWPRMCVLSSEHTDGRTIAYAVSWRGVVSVAGSSTRGGRAAYKGLLRAIRDGLAVALTPDGPKGPIHEVKDGVIRLAQQTGKPILPISYGAVWRKQFASWDEMILPYPFSKAVLSIGEPMYVPRECTEEEVAAWGQKLKAELDLRNRECDEYGYP
jgi:lysophospholipid acyltransferase (LPLAT)-like uncharacterized protein